MGLPDLATATVLAEIDALPHLHEMTPVQARAAFEVICTRFGAAPVDGSTVASRTIPGPVGDIAVRVYTPAGVGPFPVLIYFPGGGFVVGSPRSVHGPATIWARDVEALVVVVDYAKAPEFPFPAAFDDALAVARWVSEHVGEWNGDSTRIAVAGDSAGGNLSAVVAIDARDRGDTALRGQVLIYPATDITRKRQSVDDNGDGYFLDKKMLRWFGENTAADPQDWRASPMIVDDLSGLAPAFVVTAELDPMRDQGEAYAQRLVDAGVDVVAQRYDGQVHGFVANLAGAVPRGRQAIDEVSTFLRRALA